MSYSRPAPRVRAYRPRFEVLEARHLLSTYVVDRLTDGGAGSGLAGDLRYCINQAADGDAITFGVTGTINLTGFLPVLTHSISIEGPGAGLMTVRRDTGGDYNIFTVDYGPTVSISGLTITNGSVTNLDGGGIVNAGTLTLTDCLLSGNSAGGFAEAFGGGIYNLGTLTVSNCTISGNTAFAGGAYIYENGYGGGIYNEGTLTVSDCTITGNSANGHDDSPGYAGAGFGGGIDNAGTLTLSNSTVAGNHASGDLGGGAYGDGAYGGGIFNGISYGFRGDLIVNYSTISGNTALASSYDRVSGNGGGIFNQGTLTVTISNSTLSGNSAGSAGGGIDNAGTLTVSDSTLAGNSASGSSHGLNCYGGGIENDFFGTLTVSNSTLSGNSASGGFSNTGGGIDNAGTLTVSNSILSGNYAGFGGGIDNFFTGGGSLQAHNTIIAGNTAPYAGPDVYGNLGSQGHNLIGNPQDVTGLVPSDLRNVDPLLGPLQDNGGPTPTMALLSGSPAIDAGDNTNAPLWDQRGAPFRRIVHGTIDIGAFEVQARGYPRPTPQPLPDPVPVQALGTPAGPLFGPPPALPADPSPLPGPGIPDGQTVQPAPVPTAGGQQAPATLFGTYPGTEQALASLGSLSANDLDALTLNMLGGP
jgi:hypothetical protein